MFLGDLWLVVIWIVLRFGSLVSLDTVDFGLWFGRFGFGFVAICLLICNVVFKFFWFGLNLDSLLLVL